MEKYGPLDGRKYRENNKDTQMGQVKPKKYLKKIILAHTKLTHWRS